MNRESLFVGPLFWGAFRGQHRGYVGFASLVWDRVPKLEFSDPRRPRTWPGRKHTRHRVTSKLFRRGGRKPKTTLKTQNRKEADATLLRFEENIGLLGTRPA